MAKKTTLLPPDSQEREYTRLLLRFSRDMQRDVNQLLIPRIGDFKQQFDREMRGDGAFDDLSALMAVLLQRAGLLSAPLQLALPNIMQSINRHNDRQFQMVVKSNTGKDVGQLGVNVFRNEPFLRPLADSWIKTSTDLIKSLPTRFYPELEWIIRRGVISGLSVKDIQNEIKGRYGVSDYRARLIAQDQTTKFHSQLTEYRLKSVGVEKYIWRSVQDSRVRPDHADRNGKEFSWDKPPYDGHPGQPVRCRCRAEAVWDWVE